MVVQGVGSAAATSVTIPAHQAGDMIVVMARGTVAPTVPTAGGTVPTWVTQQTGAANSLGLVTATAVANNTNHTTGTWTNATHMIVLVIRPTSSGGVLSAGASTVGSAANTLTLVFAALTLQTADGSSMVVRVGARAAASSGTEMATPPSGYTNQQVQPAGTAALMTLHTRLNVNANPTSDTVNMAGSNAAYRTNGLEIKEVMGSLNVSDSTVPTDAASFQSDMGLSVADSSTPTDSLGQDDTLLVDDATAASEAPDIGVGIGVNDTATPTDALVTELNPCFESEPIVGKFIVGDGTIVGRWTMCVHRPVLNLLARPFSTTVTSGSTTSVNLSKPKITLVARSFAVGLSSSPAFGRPTLVLRARALYVPPFIHANLLRPRLVLVGRHVTLGLSSSPSLGRPVLILKTHALLRVGQPALIPTIPEDVLLVPTTISSVPLLVPTVERDDPLLVPTSVIVR